MANTQTFNITCPVCTREGAHTDTCAHKNRFPIRASCDEDFFIKTVTMTTGDKLTNHVPDEANSFTTNMLPAFASGRMLIHSDDNTHWQKFSNAFEEILLAGNGHAGPASSTILGGAPGRHGRASLGGVSDITLGDSTSGDISTSLAKANLQTTFATNLPKFDGNEANFEMWREQVKRASRYTADDVCLDIILSKLDSAPLAYLKGTGKPNDSVDAVLDTLAARYSPYSQPHLAYMSLMHCKQGTRNVYEYNTEFLSILRAAGDETLQTMALARSAYISGLSAPGNRKHLLKRLEKKPDFSLTEMMDDVAQDERAVRADAGNTTPAPVAAYDVNIASPQPGANTTAHTQTASTQFSINAGYIANRTDSTPRRQPPPLPTRPPGGGPWCEIHAINTHETAQCKELNRTGECRWCRVPLDNMPFLEHVRICTARRCFTCGRRGHLAIHHDRSAQQTTPSKSQYTPVRNRPQNKVFLASSDLSAADWDADSDDGFNEAICAARMYRKMRTNRARPAPTETASTAASTTQGGGDRETPVTERLQKLAKETTE